MILASMAGWVQMRSMANQKLAARLATDLREGLARDAVHDRLRGLVADQMTANLPRNDRPMLDGTEFELQQGGARWDVRVQDVQGVIDLYLTNQAILDMALPESAELRTQRDAAVGNLPLGGRFPHLPMTLARFGLSEADPPLFTQSSPDSLIRPETAPPDLRRRLGSLAPHLVAAGPVTKVQISVRRAGPATQ